MSTRRDFIKAALAAPLLSLIPYSCESSCSHSFTEFEAWGPGPECGYDPAKIQVLTHEDGKPRWKSPPLTHESRRQAGLPDYPLEYVDMLCCTNIPPLWLREKRYDLIAKHCTAKQIHKQIAEITQNRINMSEEVWLPSDPIIEFEMSKLDDEIILLSRCLHGKEKPPELQNLHLLKDEKTILS